MGSRGATPDASHAHGSPPGAHAALSRASCSSCATTHAPPSGVMRSSGRGLPQKRCRKRERRPRASTRCRSSCERTKMAATSFPLSSTDTSLYSEGGEA
ncbi:hypothetical protein EMIHUDRAFT_444459 [Emiliania huxleyi CCMP1516]|uniref:Uncharacterized protein n=2 Tax=Emiliania huxleyi TaxID=2903 RepID=A0A0D3JD43_EMIH1|nr:hypothetical protein EMIHUDRAFT_444459 [Emiliania huxleyi CCMP1516]EOD21428.1 hypothetical protein EMIHUDRAFT_444459 [Emiliania huxleyi CCMP1516]|eukprot:XP_005773857.1 hypothetical protein EMIHUDRAFT_444459 [Emiliania huxleyi CCMP1516]